MVATILSTTTTPTAQLYEHFVLDSKPVGYWRLGETSGTIAINSTGTGNDLTYINAPTLGVAGALAGDTDTAVKFVTSSYADGADVKAIYTSGSFECWVDTTQWGLDTNHHGLYQNSTGWSNQANGVSLFRYSNGHFYFRVMTPGAVIQDIQAPWRTYFGNIDGWHHVVGTWDVSGMVLYIDGVAIASRACTPPNAASSSPATRVSLGHAQPGNGHVMDEVALYDRVLTAPEIQRHYSVGYASRYGFRALDLDTVPHPILETVDAYQFDWATTPA